MTTALQLAPGALFVAVVVTGSAAILVAWVKILLLIARSSIEPRMRTPLFFVTLISGPFVGSVIGWVALRIPRLQTVEPL